MNHFRLYPELKIKTCFGPVDEWDYAVAVTHTATKIVLDLTALITLLFLEDDFWTNVDRELIISEGTFNRLKDIEPARDDYTAEGGWVSWEKGQLSVGAKKIQQAQLEHEKVKKFIEQVGEKCNIVNGAKLNEIETDKRKICIDTVGRANAETMVLASQNDSLLWTDDLALASLANFEFGCKRTWSQVIVYVFGGEKISNINIKLFRYGYIFTKIHLNELKSALEQSNWQINQAPLSEIISIFSDNDISQESIVPLFSNFIKYIWQNGNDFIAQQITIAVLNEFSKRQLGHFIIGVMPVDKIFGFDCVNAYKVSKVIRYWLRINAKNEFLY